MPSELEKMIKKFDDFIIVAVNMVKYEKKTFRDVQKKFFKLTGYDMSLNDVEAKINIYWDSIDVYSKDEQKRIIDSVKIINKKKSKNTKKSKKNDK